MNFLQKNTIAYTVFISVSVAASNALAVVATATVQASTVPEMSDYLAMAFVAITGGYLVYRTNKRKRTTI